MGRLLILACGATKRPDDGLLPAIDRYDGPPYRTLRKALRDLMEDQHPRVLILSARYGLICADTHIPNYNDRLTASRAVALRTQVRRALGEALEAGGVTTTFINLGAAYLPALALDPSMIAQLGLLTYARGGIGERMGQMKRWLHSV